MGQKMCVCVYIYINIIYYISHEECRIFFKNKYDYKCDMDFTVQ